MTLRSVRSDIVYLVLLCAFLGSYLTGVFDFAHDFVAAFGHWIWAAYSGILFFFYPLVQRRISRFNVSTFFILLGRLLLLFFLSVGFAVVFGLWLRPQDRGEWQLGAFFLVMPALLVAPIAFILGFTARLLRNRII